MIRIKFIITYKEDLVQMKFSELSRPYFELGDTYSCSKAGV